MVARSFFYQSHVFKSGVGDSFPPPCAKETEKLWFSSIIYLIDDQFMALETSFGSKRTLTYLQIYIFRCVEYKSRQKMRYLPQFIVALYMPATRAISFLYQRWLFLASWSDVTCATGPYFVDKHASRAS